MEGEIRLTREEADWLSAFSGGYSWEPESDDAIPASIADRLVHKGLLCRDHGWLDITLRGMTLARRCTVLGDRAASTMAPGTSAA